MYVALVGGVVFILIQVWLLIFFARSLGNKITHKITGGGNRCCWYGGKDKIIQVDLKLYSSRKMNIVVSFCCTLLCYTITALGTVVLFSLFTSWNGCASNKIFIGVNAFLCILLSVISALTCCGPSKISYFLNVCLIELKCEPIKQKKHIQPYFRQGLCQFT